jgi:hypothetical protein
VHKVDPSEQTAPKIHRQLISTKRWKIISIYRKVKLKSMRRYYEVKLCKNNQVVGFAGY